MWMCGRRSRAVSGRAKAEGNQRHIGIRFCAAHTACACEIQSARARHTREAHGLSTGLGRPAYIALFVNSFKRLYLMTALHMLKLSAMRLLLTWHVPRTFRCSHH